MSDVEIIEGDCRTVMAAMKPGSVDAIVTDPPFGTEAAKDGYGRRFYGGVGRFIAGDADLDAFDGMLVEASRVLATNAWVVVFCSPKRHAETAHILESRGFPVAGEAVWDKASPGLGGGIRYQHETILLCKRGEIAGRNSMFSVLRCHLSRENKHLRHPHEKPVPVLTELVRYCSTKGQIVLDPFAGSGSTLVACLKTGRRGIGIELDAGYCEIARRRVSEAATPLFEAIG